MFNFLKRKEHKVDVEETLKQFVSLTLNDDKLSMPLYIPEIEQESDAEKLGIGPLVYIWNVDHAAGTYSLSVNGKCVGYLLEAFIPRTHPSFSEIRDKAMQIISDVSINCVSETIKKTGLMPDVLFNSLNSES
ncbi:hypothetical protein AAHA48_05140 [Dickeya oryzae]|uniref:Uncharacterized protein n=1 Tax=Dickeya oryzae TaxID=1240404 RepID=A0ABS5BG47_9GAMM|nr:hypothetical protein [Dickeya oryzae]MBP2859400.1 hypothetical protein [Dickeya oryzae]